MCNTELTSLLVQGLKGDKRNEVLGMIQSARPLLRILEEKLKEEYYKLENKIDDNFDDGWQYRQASNVGLKKGLTRAIEYVIIKEIKK